MISLAIIIVNYKSEKETINFVKGELSKLNNNFYLIIVNNSSDINSDRVLCKKLKCSLVNDINHIITSETRFVISSKDNLGFAKGNNLGALLANKINDVKYILFTNNDIRILNAETTNLLIKKMQEKSDIGVIGPDCLDIDGNSQSPRPYISFFNKYITSNWISFFMSKKFKNKIMNFDYAKYAEEGYHYKLSGSFFLVNCIDFFNCGMMDPLTFLYCEEEILAERMSKIGKTTYYYPNVKIIHEHNQTVGKFLNIKKRMYLDFESNSIYYKNYKGVGSLSIFFGKLNHLLFFYLKLLIKKKKYLC